MSPRFLSLSLSLRFKRPTTAFNRTKMMEMMTTTTFSSSSSPFSNRNNPKTQLQKYSLSLSLFSLERENKRHKKTRQKTGQQRAKIKKKQRERSIFFQLMEEEILYLSLSLSLLLLLLPPREISERRENDRFSSHGEASLSLSRRARALGGFKKKYAIDQKLSSPSPFLPQERERESNSFLFLCPGRENIWREKPKKRKTKSLLSLFFYLDANGLSSRGRRSDGSSVERD